MLNEAAVFDVRTIPSAKFWGNADSRFLSRSNCLLEISRLRPDFVFQSRSFHCLSLREDFVAKSRLSRASSSAPWYLPLEYCCSSSRFGLHFHVFFLGLDFLAFVSGFRYFGNLSNGQILKFICPRNVRAESLRDFNQVELKITLH